MPLGLVVALLKDSSGNIDFQVPISGTLSRPELDWGEAIWAGVKQVLIKVARLALQRHRAALHGGGGDEKVEKLEGRPGDVPAGSSVIAPSMEAHLDRVAEFLRRLRIVKLTLAPVATAADIESLKEQEVTAKIQRIQRERGSRQLGRARWAYYRDQSIEGRVPATAEEQLAVLQAREPVSEGA